MRRFALKLRNGILAVAGLSLLMGCGSASNDTNNPQNSPLASPILPTGVPTSGALNQSPLAVPTANLGVQFTLSIGETANFDDGLAITFTGVPEDSRCPQNARCIQAGQARVIVHAVAPGKTPADLQLTLGVSETDAFAAYQGYKIQLAALDPFPTVGDNATKAPYRATFVVTKE